MDQSLLRLVQNGRISQEEALRHSINSEWMQKRLAAVR